MRFYNSKGVFSNTQDDLDTLGGNSQKRFSDVSLDIVGCGALFSARLL